MNETEDKRVGTTIDGRFRLERLLGAGGMGKVYYGYQLSVDRPVAVKVLRSDLSELPTVQQRFFREAKVLASLHHPNIVGLVDFGRDDETGALYMAMQYVDGKALTDLVDSGRLPLAVSLAIARQICSGLAEAHAAGVVHRDLKPDNVMLQTTAEGTVVAKILDFGIALPTGKEETRFTATGAIVGTPFYMSPEQAQDKPVGPQSDLYSVGVILYEMITGAVPFTGDTPLAVMFKTVNERHTPIQELFESPRIRGPLADLTDELLAKDPSQRPASASEVARRLEELRRGLEIPSMDDVEMLETLVQPGVSSSTGPVAPAAMAPSPAETASVADARNERTETSHDESESSGVSVALMLGGLAVILGLVVIAAGAVGFMVLGERFGDDSSDSAVAQVPEPDRAEVLAAEATTPAPKKTARPSVANRPARPAAPTKPKRASATKTPEPKPAAATERPKSAPEPKPAKRDARPTPSRADRKDRSNESGACQNRACAVNLTTKDAHYACQGATCSVGCEAGGCGQVCQAESTCLFDCAGGGCRQSCFGGTKCVLSCSGGNCDRTAFSGAEVIEND